MASELTEIVRRINKLNLHLSREGDMNLKHAYLQGIVEASQELSTQMNRKWL